MQAARQTISFLNQRFREVGLRPDSRRGQNFLIDLNLVQLLARSAEVSPQDVVLEVGTGMGSLTAMLAADAETVVTVEVDRNLYGLAAEELLQYNNVRMLCQDALKNKNTMHPLVIETVTEALGSRLSENTPARAIIPGFKLAANLPYNIATPIVSNLLLSPVVPESMTVTIQRELAERITARPRCKDYSALSVWMQVQCDTEIVRIMRPGVFWPRPKVESAIIRIVPRADLRGRIADLDFFHGFARSMFMHRRKFLRSVLVSAYKHRLDKPGVDEILADQALDAKSRSEELDIDQMLSLCDAIRAKLAAGA